MNWMGREGPTEKRTFYKGLIRLEISQYAYMGNAHSRQSSGHKRHESEEYGYCGQVVGKKAVWME